MIERALFATILVAACSGGSKTPATSSITHDDSPAPTPSSAQGEEVTFTADDGVVLSGTYFHSGSESNACYILVHQLSSTRAEWKPVIDRLPAGAHILAFDMRGHGASTKAADRSTISWKAFETADWEKVEGDVGKAKELVNGRRMAEPQSACVLAGSSIGSSAVLRYSGAHPTEVTALLLLSPGIAYRGVKTPDAARASTARTLIVHSQENGAADAAGALAGIWRDATPPVNVDVIVDPGDAHGMKIVAGDPAILDKVVTFLREPSP